MTRIKKDRGDKNLWLFFGLTLSWTWICGFIPIIFGFTGTGFGTFIFYFGGGAPSVVALFLVFFTYSNAARKDYFHRCFSFKYMGWRWPLFTFGGFLAITVISLYIGVYFLGYEMPTMDFLDVILANPLMIFPVLLISFLSGPLNEEFGWRGYALDKLLLRFGFSGASAILGFVWGIWHLAWFFTPGQAQYNLLQDSLLQALMYIPSVMMLSFFDTFIYIKTKRSILAGALVHMFSNLLGSQLIATYTTEISVVVRYTQMLFFVVVITCAFYWNNFKSEVAEQVKIVMVNNEFFADDF
ncbi:type II CAAX endopeptidase family protein [Eubacteriaceae bacterium ES2]|nr:type II CAAX endopeptidase family protein [Eubacteriaceae bacterium ES2]